MSHWGGPSGKSTYPLHCIELVLKGLLTLLGGKRDLKRLFVTHRHVSITARVLLINNTISETKLLVLTWKNVQH